MTEMQKTKTINDFRFHFRQESILMVYQERSYIAFHSFNQKNKRKLRNFQNQIVGSREMDLDRLYRLARIYQIPSVSTTSASLRPLPRKILPDRQSSTRIAW